MCTLTPNVVLTAPLALTYNTPLPGGTATISGTGSSLTTVLSGADGGGINCTLMITATGDSATVPMQTCETTIMTIPVIITFTSGTVTLSGQTLTAMANVTVSGVPDGGTTVAGTGSLDATCTKM
jgi:hypothetical protein